MTLMRRPIEIRSMASTVQAALRDRRRQYARREEFAERDRQTTSLRENDRHKDEFLAMLAHELRNPLAAVKNAVNVLKMPSANEQSRNWASDVIERQVKQLVRLIDDLLDVSRITSGKIHLRKDFVDVSSILSLAIEAARPLIDERKHALTVSIEDGELPLYVDEARVEQIVLNLLTNAAKYTESGGSIWLSAKREGDQIVISVKDNGTGIAPEKLPEMFKLFSQGDRSLARSEGGLGLGLTIVQKLTEMHGGVVVAKSEGLDMGSEFIVSLPLIAKPLDTGPDAQPDQSVSARGYRILIVDDNMDTARGMVQLMNLLGNEAIAVYDGHAAIETARTCRPDFILLDIGLPGMDGYQVASALREDEASKDAVIIAVSGYGQEEDQRRSLAAGFDHHLVKPVDFDLLISLIERPS
jgi:signal transduction histidine kinase/CheY-like chemotaxis protein